MDWKLTPKILILSMLHVSTDRALPIRVLVAIGALFGFTGNTVRVTTARLVQDGRIESDERGLYRLKDRGTPISRFVDTWRNETPRVKDWDGSWICCLLPRAAAGQARKNAKALALPGFREGLPHLWVRPNNLTMGLDAVRDLLLHQGMDGAGELFVGEQFSPLLVDGWTRDLWPAKEIIRASEAARRQIVRSRKRLPSLPVQDALVESYLVGTEGIYWLLKDPLLPEEMIPSRYRIDLTGALLAYDELGKGIWKREFAGLRPRHAPTQAGLAGL